MLIENARIREQNHLHAQNKSSKGYSFSIIIRVKLKTYPSISFERCSKPCVTACVVTFAKPFHFNPQVKSLHMSFECCSFKEHHHFFYPLEVLNKNRPEENYYRDPKREAILFAFLCHPSFFRGRTV